MRVNRTKPVEAVLEDKVVIVTYYHSIGSSPTEPVGVLRCCFKESGEEIVQYLFPTNSSRPTVGNSPLMGDKEFFRFVEEGLKDIGEGQRRLEYPLRAYNGEPVVSPGTKIILFTKDCTTKKYSNKENDPLVARLEGDSRNLENPQHL